MHDNRVALARTDGEIARLRDFHTFGFRMTREDLDRAIALREEKRRLEAAIRASDQASLAAAVAKRRRDVARTIHHT